MSWAPADLVADADLLAYERTIHTAFGQTEWTTRRSKVIEDWLWPALRQQGFDPERFRTRHAPSYVYGFDGTSTYTDYLAAATSTTVDDLPLATIFSTSSKALYIGSANPFRGISLRVLDAPNATAATLTVALWTDVWSSMIVSDGTQATIGIPFSRGGAITWTVPTTMQIRPVNSLRAYWAKLSMSTAPLTATAGQLGVIRRSLLCGPATLRTLALILREAPMTTDGPWIEKAAWYEAQADAALSRVLPLIGNEFDTDEDDIIDGSEETQTTDDARDSTGWLWERM